MEARFVADEDDADRITVPEAPSLGSIPGPNEVEPAFAWVFHYEGFKHLGLTAHRETYH